MSKETDDKGKVKLNLISGAAGFLAGLIPGEGGEEHLVKALEHGLKFADARSKAVDSSIDTDG